MILAKNKNSFVFINKSSNNENKEKKMGKSCNTEMCILKYLKEHIVKGLCNSATFILTH